MNARTKQTTIVLALVFLVVQTGAAQRRTQPSSEVPDVTGPPVQAQPGQELDAEGAADLASIERGMQGAYEKIAPAVVRITYGTRAGREWSGSGVIVTAEGHVVTVASYVRLVVDDKLLGLHLADGRRVPGKALGFSDEFAIGLLKITQKGPWPHVDLGKGADVEVGEFCVAIGYPGDSVVGFDRWPTLRPGSVRKSAVPIWLTSSCQMFVGGECVFDWEGRLIGLTNSASPLGGDSTQSSVEMVRTHWDDLVAGKNVDRARLLSFQTDGGESAKAAASESQSGPEEKPAAEVIEKATLASVRISKEGQTKGLVSGVIVTAHGYVITCGHHKQLPGQKVNVSLSGGRDALGVVLGTNLVSDVGLIKITDEGPWPHAAMGDSSILKPGDRCVRTGYPIALPGRKPWVLQTEIIEPSRRRDERSIRFWTSGGVPRSMGSGSGCSGGGIFDMQGRVVGVHLGENLGRTRNGGVMQSFHARVELLRVQWDLLATSKPVDVADSDPLVEVNAAFCRIAEDLPPIAVEVLVDGKPRVLGTIVRSDGRILTKASELGEAVSCRLADGRVLPTSVEKVFEEHDLALLKIDATGLPEAHFGEGQSIAPGTLIAALIPGEAARAGVVSPAARARPPANGGLAADLGDGDGGVRVGDVIEGYDVPLRKGDVVLHVEGKPTPDLDTYFALFQPASGPAVAYAGDTVRVGVRRSDEMLELHLRLPPLKFSRHSARGASRRWWGFPSVFGTDIRLTAKECGGPVIDKSGRVVGIVIAYLGDRHFGQRDVLPAHVVRKVVADLAASKD